jgi:2C-methyl-D-erythritol 2,4-cyclodiphosphate synthase
MGVKAKTAEGTGEIGEGKGISAYAVVLLVKSEE